MGGGGKVDCGGLCGRGREGTLNQFVVSRPSGRSVTVTVTVTGGWRAEGRREGEGDARRYLGERGERGGLRVTGAAGVCFGCLHADKDLGRAP